MSKIGKAIFVSGGMIFDFTLTIGGTSYHFDNKSVSSEVANTYKYDRVKQGNVDKWDLYVYTSGTITFSKLKHLIDCFAIGGGGGGGGGCCGGSNPGWGHTAGYGGGGRFNTVSKTHFASNTAYTLTVGTGGGGGAPGPGSRGNPGDWGGSGNPSSITYSNGTVLSVSGGSPGAGSDSSDSAKNPADLTYSTYCFGDNTYPQVGGNNEGNIGGGGAYGYGVPVWGGDPYATWGHGGRAGLIAIRSTPKE